MNQGLLVSIFVLFVASAVADTCPSVCTGYISNFTQQPGIDFTQAKCSFKNHGGLGNNEYLVDVNAPPKYTTFSIYTSGSNNVCNYCPNTAINGCTPQLFYFTSALIDCQMDLYNAVSGFNTQCSNVVP